MFITFEGGEGSGKSTHAKRLKSFLEGKGRKVLLTQEPGGTQLGKEIRALLLHPKITLEPLTEIFLFAADRSEHISKVIKPALEAGKIVVSDRFIDSTVAYQVGGRGMSEELVNLVNLSSARGLVPDLTILLDVSPEVGIVRATKKAPADRFEKERSEFHRRVREKYLEIAQANSRRIKVIKTDDKDIEQVQKLIRQLVDAHLR